MKQLKTQKKTPNKMKKVLICLAVINLVLASPITKNRHVENTPENRNLDRLNNYFFLINENHVSCAH